MTTLPGAAAPARPTIIVIDGTPALQLQYRSVLVQAGYSVTTASTAAEGLAEFEAAPAKLVLLDLALPDRSGLLVTQDIHNRHPDTVVIAMTAQGTVTKAVEAMRAGAADFLVKPFDENRLLNAVAGVLGGPVRRAAARASGEPAQNPETGTGDTFIGSSKAMQRIHTAIESVSRSMATVFITGESGTGKELCALALHAKSARAAGPFIALNCGAIPQDLLESEVFGHMKGSFTGAISDKLGAATAADGGTLFLDEICEMAPALQTKLLRFLQTSTVVPVGATRPRKVNVRIVCATNRDPMDAVRTGHFREDLFYRLFVVPIHMPPLRDRGDDMIEIAQTALRRFATEEGKVFDGLTPAVQTIFRNLPWPGNVRQVLNVIRNVVVLNDGGTVTPEMLPNSLNLHDRTMAQQSAVAGLATTIDLESLLNRPLAEVEKIVIEATLLRFGGSVPKASRVLDLSPSTLYRKLEGWAKP